MKREIGVWRVAKGLESGEGKREVGEAIAMRPTSLPPLFSLTNPNLPSVGVPTDISVELAVILTY